MGFFGTVRKRTGFILPHLHEEAKMELFVSADTTSEVDHLVNGLLLCRGPVGIKWDKVTDAKKGLVSQWVFEIHAGGYIKGNTDGLIVRVHEKKES